MVTFSRAGLVPDHDVVIVGAGAAGVAAARHLHAKGLRTRVLEARGRVGGRAWTLRDGMPAPLDLGCEWLHSADENAVVPVARELGLTIDETKPRWGTHSGRHFPDRDREAFQAASNRFWDSLETAARDGRPDHAAADLLEPGNPWNPLIEAISTYYNGAKLETVSIVDLDRYVDTGVNWRIAEGYGTFVETAAAGVDIVLGCTVTAIDHSGPLIRVATTRGEITARSVIITLPTDVLASGAIDFRPGLPHKRDAAAALPLGLADKIFFRVDGLPDLASSHVFGTTDRAETISFDVKPRDTPLVQGFVGGEFARALERAGPRAFEAEARAQLGYMLGEDVQPHLTFLASTAWSGDPFAMGSYSHAKPGFADCRAILAQPVDDRLFFAGEACSTRFFSTAHGAWETGIAAADQVLAALWPDRPVEASAWARQAQGRA